MRTRHQKGNLLFLILIAVGLFAALSYAVTNSSVEIKETSSTKSFGVETNEVPPLTPFPSDDISLYVGGDKYYCYKD